MSKVVLILFGLVLALIVSFALFFAINFISSNDRVFIEPKNYIIDPLPDQNWKDGFLENEVGRPPDFFKFKVDNLGRRFVPGLEGKKREKFFVLAGGSFTFGDHLRDDQTLAYFLGQKSNYKPYVYAFSGFGPHHFLYRIREKNIKSEIAEKEGVFGFLLIDDHILRASGKMSSCCPPFGPWYDLDKSGNIEFKGYFESLFFENRFIYTEFNKKVMQSLNISAEDFFLTKKDFYKTCKILSEMNIVISKKFPKSKFVVFLYPGFPVLKKIRSCLKANDVPYLDHASLWAESSEKSYFLSKNHHPNEKANEVISDLLLKGIQFE
jgi:hypothetical protein